MYFRQAGYRCQDGQEFPNAGCFLEVIERLVWTNVLAPHGSGTKYTALVIHGNEEDRKKHEAMGFHDGWGKALDQLVAMVKKMRADIA
jgi:uncharacterized protein YndB with AHSA1/START domain